MKKVLMLTLVWLMFIGSVYAADNCAASLLLMQRATPAKDIYDCSTAWTANYYYAYYNHTLAGGGSGVAGNRADSTAGCDPGCLVFTNTAATCTGAGCVNCATIPTTGCGWDDNNSCATVTGCDGIDDGGLQAGDRTAFFAFTWSTSAPYTSKFVADLTFYDASVTCLNFSNSDGTMHRLGDLPAPTFSSAVCDGTTCTVGVTITNPVFDSTGATGGIYGDDADLGAGSSIAARLIAGYMILGVQSAAAPANPLLATWTKVPTSGQFIARSTAATSTGTVTFNVTGDTNNLYISYAPVFNYNGACAGWPCTAGEVQTIVTNYSVATGAPMHSRVVSVASIPISPTPTTFSSFTAAYASLQQVNLAWTTASETDAIGFNLYRSLDGASWTQVNTALIPAKGQGGAGASYAFTDNLPKQRVYQPWKYKVEEMSNTGTRIAETTTEATK